MFSSVAPKILTPLRDLKLKAGQALNLEIEFTGEPEPTVQWKVNASDLPSSLTATTVEGKTSIFAPGMRREDSGEYELVLRNANGSDRGCIQIIVQGYSGC